MTDVVGAVLQNVAVDSGIGANNRNGRDLLAVGEAAFLGCDFDALRCGDGGAHVDGARVLISDEPESGDLSDEGEDDEGADPAATIFEGGEDAGDGSNEAENSEVVKASWAVSGVTMVMMMVATSEVMMTTTETVLRFFVIIFIALLRLKLRLTIDDGLLLLLFRLRVDERFLLGLNEVRSDRVDLTGAGGGGR